MLKYERNKLVSIVRKDPNTLAIHGVLDDDIYSLEEEMVWQINEITDRGPGSNIQVAVPLLIELNLQYIFHKVLVVYIPSEMQIEHLARRDGISNEEMRRQVLELWQTLKGLRQSGP
jgi:dephospho-CoA kinase